MASAQIPFDTLHTKMWPDSTIVLVATQNPNGAFFSFDHLLSIYDWHARANLWTSETPQRANNEARTIDTVILTASSRFLSDNSIRSSAAAGFVYADDALNGSAVRPVIEFEGSTTQSSGVPGLSAATLVPGATDGFATAGLRYFPSGTNFDLTAMGGLAELKQSGVSVAAGPMLKAVAAAPFETLGENGILIAGANADERFFRQNNERYSSDSIVASVMNPIGSSSLLDSNYAYLTANLDRRNFFYTTDSGSQPIKQDWRELGLSLRDSIHYPVSGRAVTATLAGALEPGSIQRTSDISIVELKARSFSAVSSLLVPNVQTTLHSFLGGRLDYVDAAWSAEGRMSYDDRSQNEELLSSSLVGLDPSLISKFATILNESNYDQRVTQAGGTITYQPSRTERFQIGADANLLNYDTPSPLNDDDHDELITSATARYDRLFSDELHGWADIRAARTHLVYLLSDHSASNNVTQSLTLTTHGVFQNSSIYARADGEVFANYTILDYLDSVPQLAGIGNYVMRGLTVSDTVSTSLGIRPFASFNPLMLAEGALFGIQERGSYDEQTFSEVVSSRITQLSAMIAIVCSTSQGAAPWSIQAGARAFVLVNQGNFTGASESNPFGTLETQVRVGPIVTISFLRPRAIGPMLFGSLWYSVLKDVTYSGPDVESGMTRTPEVEAQLSAQWTF